MEIHVRDLVSKGLKLPIRASPDVAWLRQVRKDVIGVSPLKVDLTASGSDGTAHVEGELAIEVELACSRCLDPVKEKLVIPFDERFKPASGGQEPEDEEIIALEEDKVDLEPFLEETLLLSLPFVPLCGDDCKGLCHTCGANLNMGTCGCVKDVIDPRMAALKDLFKQS